MTQSADMIRHTVPTDAEQIAAIYNQYIENTVCTFETAPVSPSEMASRISSEYPWFVADDGTGILGYAYAARWKPRSAYDRTVETSVYVAPDSCRRGLGSELYRKLLDQLRSDGFHCALGGIALPNPASVAFHERLGFRKVAELEEVGWKFGRWVNVGYWQMIL